MEAGASHLLFASVASRCGGLPHVSRFGFLAQEVSPQAQKQEQVPHRNLQEARLAPPPQHANARYWRSQVRDDNLSVTSSVTRWHDDAEYCGAPAYRCAEEERWLPSCESWPKRVSCHPPTGSLNSA